MVLINEKIVNYTFTYDILKKYDDFPFHLFNEYADNALSVYPVDLLIFAFSNETYTSTIRVVGRHLLTGEDIDLIYDQDIGIPITKPIFCKIGENTMDYLGTFMYYYEFFARY